MHVLGLNANSHQGWRSHFLIARDKMSARICKRSIRFTGKPALKKKLKTPGCLLACCVENCIKDSDGHSKWIVFSCEWCPPPLLFGLKLVVSTCLFFFGWGTEHGTFEGNTWPGRVGQVLARSSCRASDVAGKHWYISPCQWQSGTHVSTETHIDFFKFSVL
jgi:hypothetical protein